MMALDKTFASGEVLSAGDVNGYLLSMWAPIDKHVITSGSPVTSVSFQSINSNFRIFRLTYHVIPTQGLWFRLNNDSGTNYTEQNLVASGAATGATRATSAVAIDLAMGDSNCPMQGHVIVSKPSTSTQARGTAHITSSPHATLRTSIMSISWNNTASLLNRIDVIANGGNFYGVVALEGMRGV